MTDMICSYKTVDQNLCTLIENFFSPFIDKYQCQYLSEKSPYNCFIFEHLIELFPKAHFIHVVRDPRAVIASLFEVNRRAKQKGRRVPGFTTGIREAIKYNKRCLNAAFKASQEAPGKIHNVLYERLVTNPEIETKKICQFLNIQWVEQMLYPSQLKHPGEKAATSEHNFAWYDKRMFNRDPETSSIDKWKRTLTPAQQVRITNAFKGCQELIDLGYDFSLDHLSARQKLFGSFQSAARTKIGDMRLAAGRSLKRLLPA